MGRPDTIERALLDASALIGVIQGDPDFECLKPLLAAVDAGQVKLVASTALLIEVLPEHKADLANVVRAAVRALLEGPSTELVDVGTAVARKATEMRVKYGLKTWDAVHLATAILAKANVLIVRDDKFPLGDVEGVWVSKPYDINDDKLFS